MKKQYAYLVSDTEKLSLTFKKPKDVKIEKNKWYLRSLKFDIGEAVTLYTDGLWQGTVGVYDLSDPNQTIAMVDDMRQHTRAITDNKINTGLGEIFGKEAQGEVDKYRYCSHGGEQRDFKWTKLGGLLFNARQVVHRVCFPDGDRS